MSNIFIIRGGKLQDNIHTHFYNQDKIHSLFSYRAQKEGIPKDTIIPGYLPLDDDKSAYDDRTRRAEISKKTPAKTLNSDISKSRKDDDENKLEKEDKKMPEDLQMSENGTKELAKYEKFMSYPYDDHNPNKKLEKWNGNATIGYGHLIDKEEWDMYKNGISKEEAIKLKQKDIEDHEQIVKNHINIPLTQNQYDALVMRAYNTGPGGFIDDNKTRSKEMTDYINSGKDLNTKEFAEIYQARCFSKQGYMRGIENRRIKELDYMNTGKVNEDPTYLKSRRLYEPKPKKIKK